MGAVLGAAAGNMEAIPSRWRDQLVAKEELAKEIDAFLSAVLSGEGSQELP